MLEAHDNLDLILSPSKDDPGKLPNRRPRPFDRLKVRA
jgi:hypothetical protein